MAPSPALRTVGEMAFNPGKYIQFLILLLLSGSALSQHIVKTLPGYPAELPFRLETGYISVGAVEFFYYFVESESNPAADPLLLYLNGGPGCSGLNGFFFQIGPLKFDIFNYTGGLPTLLYESYAWTKDANIIFLDSPIGAGFSYSTTLDGWDTTDIESSKQVASFLRHWLANHTSFQTNPVYIGSDSYAGLNVPLIALDIIEGNNGNLQPIINLKGLSLGCPHTDRIIETNAKIVMAHRLTLISDEMYELAKESCDGDYANVAANNTECVEALDAINKCVELISFTNVLDPYCAVLSPEQPKTRRYLRGNSGLINFFPQSGRGEELYCHNFPYLLIGIWGNYKSVQEALGVREGTFTEFRRCNISLAYTVDMNTVVPQHKNLTNTGLQVLVYSGDHDMAVPHNGIEKWISSLDLTIDIDWRPWFVEGQVAGYTRKYENSGYRLTYATIKGAGHSPQEYQRNTCYLMFHRWIHYYPL